MNRFGSQSTAPVKVGDEMDITIEAVGAKGDGLARKEGFVLFVPGVQQGDNVRVKVTRVLKKVGFAEVVGQADGSAPTEGADDGQEVPADDGQEVAEDAPAEDANAADDGQEVAEEPKEEAPAEDAPADDSEDFGEEEPKKE